MTGLQLEWQWAEEGPAAPAVVRPLVVLLPWVWSELKYVNKYTAICHQVRAAATCFQYQASQDAALPKTPCLATASQGINSSGTLQAPPHAWLGG